MTSVYPLERCRVCGNPSLVPCVSLGEQYLSSIFPANLNYRKEMPPLPLELVLCKKKEGEANCGLLQLAHQFDLSTMYDSYPYASSTNSSMKSILQEVAESGRAQGHLRADDLILDVGGNDGTLLSFFQNDRFDLLNIDSAKNITPILDSKNYTHLREFFSEKVFRRATSKRARLVFSIAMFYHLSDPLGFSKEVASCLDNDGVWIIQMAYLPSMLKTNMYDNIVHEHFGYYALQTMQWLMDKVGLEIFDCLLNEVYGGSFRLFVKRRGCRKFLQTDRFRSLWDAERRSGIFGLETYGDFSRRIEKTKKDLLELIRRLNHQGKKIWVYGSSTKGNTLLQYCGLGKDDIVAAADAHPFKVGKWMIGSDIPIRDETSMRMARPDYLLVLPYSFVNSFMKRESELVHRGTRFIVPLPEVRLEP